MCVNKMVLCAFWQTVFAAQKRKPQLMEAHKGSVKCEMAVKKSGSEAAVCAYVCC